MKLRQYVYFAVRSDTIDSERLTERIGIAPDQVAVRGSRHNQPSHPVPPSHLWRLRCDEPGLNVGAQIEQLIARLTPAREALRDLIVGSGGVQAQLTVVRWFADDEGETEVISRDEHGEILEHRWLFGWHLDTAALEFLVYVGGELDVDEYDMLDAQDGWPAAER
jgi:hypothetical protein